MSEQKVARWRADSALALVAVIWGGTFVTVKGALAEISTIYFLFCRFSLAAACLLLLFLPSLRKMQRAEVASGLLAGVIAGLFLWLGFILQTVGLKYTSAGNSGFLTGLYIVLIPLISALVFRRRPARREVLGIVLAGLGMTAMTLPSLMLDFRMNRGDAMTVGCAVAFAFHLLLLAHYSRSRRTEAVALGQIVCAAALCGVSLAFEPPRARWSYNVVFALLLTAIFATAIAFSLQTWAQRHTTATRTALIFALEPVVALVTAAAIGGEKVTWYAVAGGALILAGILAVELKPSHA